MYNEVVEALMKKFNAEGMKLTPIQSEGLFPGMIGLMEGLSPGWIGFGNQNEKLYIESPFMAEKGVVYQSYIYRVYDEQRRKTEITVSRNLIFITQHSKCEVNLKTDASVDLLNKSPKEIYMAAQKMPNIIEAKDYDGLKIFEGFIKDLGMTKTQVVDVTIQNIFKIINGKLVELAKMEKGHILRYDYGTLRYSEGTFSFEDAAMRVTEEMIKLELRGTQAEIEAMNTKRLIKKSKEKLKIFFQEVERFNSI